MPRAVSRCRRAPRTLASSERELDEVDGAVRAHLGDPGLGPQASRPGLDSERSQAIEIGGEQPPARRIGEDAHVAREHEQIHALALENFE